MQTHNNHYSLSLNRHAENHNAKMGVGCISTLTSPYAGSGVERVRGTKSDIGAPLDQVMARRMQRSAHKSSILHKSTLSSVHSDLALYETTFKDIDAANNDMINNNTSLRTPLNSSAITFSKTGSKLLYTNKHRLSGLASNDNASPRLSYNDPNANRAGPLLYKNDDESTKVSWKHSVYDNPIRSVSSQQFFSEWFTSENKTAWNGFILSSVLELTAFLAKFITAKLLIYAPLYNSM